MLPVREWLNTNEAAGYLGISRSTFEEIRHNFVVAIISKTKVYSVASMKKYLKEQTLVNQ
jgi:hypothetical protein